MFKFGAVLVSGDRVLATLGFLSRTGLTGQGHRSDRCRAFSGNPVVFYWWCATCSQSASGARLGFGEFCLLSVSW